MKDAHFVKKEHTYPRTFPFADFCPKRHEQGFDIGPADRAADRTGEDQFQRGLVALFHAI